MDGDHASLCLFSLVCFYICFSFGLICMTNTHTHSTHTLSSNYLFTTYTHTYAHFD